MTDTNQQLDKKINNILTSDIDSDKLEKFYTDTQKKLQETIQKVDNYKKQAEGYIAISEYREEKKKLTKNQLLTFPKINQVKRKFESSRFIPVIKKINTTEELDLNQDLDVSSNMNYF